MPTLAAADDSSGDCAARPSFNTVSSTKLCKSCRLIPYGRTGLTRYRAKGKAGGSTDLLVIGCDSMLRHRHAFRSWRSKTMKAG